MKFEQLEQIKEKTLKDSNMDNGRKSGIRIVVGMSTCGIAAGAGAVLEAIREEITQRDIHDVTVVQTGCIGVCRLEPIVEVYVPGQEKVTYVSMNKEKAVHVVAEHIVNGDIVSKYTVGAAE